METLNDSRTDRPIFVRRHATGAVLGEADLVSFDADGFTINWTTAYSSQLHFIVIGGADLSNATVVNFDKATATGNDAITGVGFEGDVVLLLGDLGVTPNTTELDYSFFFGMAKSATERQCSNGFDEDGVPTSNTGRSQRTNRCIIQTDVSGTVVAEVDFVSFDADGFTLNYLTADGNASNYTALVLKGGIYEIGKFDGALSTGNQVVTGVGIEPKMEIIGAFCDPTSGTVEVDHEFQLSAAVSSTDRRTLYEGSEDAQAAADSSHDRRTDRCFLDRSVGSTATTDSEADFVSQDGDGFTWNWITVDGDGPEILFLAMTDLPIPLPSFTTRAGREITFFTAEILAVEEGLIELRDTVYQGVRSTIFLDDHAIVVRSTKADVITAIKTVEAWASTIVVTTVRGREHEARAAEIEAVEEQITDTDSPIYQGVRSRMFLASHLVVVRSTADAVLALIDAA
jgi:hypothetical protein